MKEVGYDTVHIDKYGNVIGSIKGKYEGPKVLMDGHIDTVPVDEENGLKTIWWRSSRWKLFGRGTTDMKGSVCAMILAGAYLAQDLKKNLLEKYSWLE